MNTYVSVYKRMHLYKFTHALYVCLFSTSREIESLHTQVHTYTIVYTYIYVCVYTYIRTYMYIYILAHTHVYSSMNTYRSYRNLEDY